MAYRRTALKRKVGPALYRVMEPGDQIVAGTWAMAGPAPAWDALGALPAIAAGVIGALVLFGNLSGPWSSSAVGVDLGAISFFLFPLQFLRKPVFIAVTQRQLICYRLAMMGNDPTRLLFCAPLTAVRVTRAGRGAFRWRAVRYSGPGAEGRSLRLNVRGRWREDLDQVLAALQVGGAGVESVPDRSPPPLLPPP